MARPSVRQQQLYESQSTAQLLCLAVSSAFPLDVTSIPTSAVWPNAQQWSFGVQRELSRAFVVNLAYVGSKGTHLTIERQLNQLAPAAVKRKSFRPQRTAHDHRLHRSRARGGRPSGRRHHSVSACQRDTNHAAKPRLHVLCRRHAPIHTFRMSIPSPDALIPAWEKCSRLRMWRTRPITHFKLLCAIQADR